MPLVENLNPPASPWYPSDRYSDPDRESHLVTLIYDSISRLYTSPFYRSFISRLKEPHMQDQLARTLASYSDLRMVIYGIGSPELWQESRLQLALALLLRWEALPIGSIEVFDPILSASECAVLEALGCQVIREDERGQRVAEAPTLFFMPHCPSLLYDNLLRANWHSSALNQIVVLGNSFNWYGRHAKWAKVCELSAAVVATAQHVIGVRKYVWEVEAAEPPPAEEEDYDFLSAFNRLSWHFFKVDHQDAMTLERTEYNEKLIL